MTGVNLLPHSSRLQKSIEVIGGTWGNLQYPNVEGELTDLYLNYLPEDLSDTFVPVPKYYWKVLHDEEAQEAVAFLGLNDIYAQGAADPCPRVCDELKAWLDFDLTDETLGRITCCSAEDFAKVVANAPDLRDGNGNWPNLLI